MSITATREPAAEARTGPPRRRWHFETKYVLLGACVLVVVYLAVIPLATMVIGSFRSKFLTHGTSYWTFSHYVDTLGSASFRSVLANTFIYGVGVTIAATIVGFALAWLVVSTNTPGKAFASVAALVPMIIPGILNTVAWALLLSPHAGPINVLLRDVHLPAFNVYSLPGMIWIQSIHVVPLAFLMGVAAFRSTDSAFAEAALMSGAPPRRVMRKITLRLARPAVLAAALLIFIQAISTFDVPQLIGVPGHTLVFVSTMYQAMENFPPDYGTVGAIGVFVVAVASLGLWASRRLSRGAGTQTITGKGFRPTVLDLGRWRWAGLAASVLFFLVAVALPLLILVWSSLLPGYEQPSLSALHQVGLGNFRAIWQNTVLARSVTNSIITSVASALIVTVLTSVIAYITVKTKIRGRGLLDTLVTVPIAVPSIVVGLGTLYWYLAAPLPVHLYGTLWILIAAYVTISLPYSLRYLAPGMAQISNELEDAATMSGATWARTFRRVFIPLLMPSLLAAFLYTLIIAFREISAPIFLSSTGTEVVSVSIFQYWVNGSYPVVAALGVLMVAFLSIVAGLVRLLSRRIGVRSAG